MPNETLAIEETGRAFLDRFYIHKGWHVEKRIEGRENREHEILINSIWYEEKCQIFDIWQAYEILQDIETLAKYKICGRYAYIPIYALGNQITSKASRQIWYCQNPKSGHSHIYRLHSKQEWNWLFEEGHAKDFPLHMVVPEIFGGRKDSRGWTICLKIPWLTLVGASIAEILYPE